MRNLLRRLGFSPPKGGVDWGSFRRTSPISPAFGNRGPFIDRHYIERFLQGEAEHIRGRVLEVAEDAYTRRFGGSRVTASDVLHLEPGRPGATLCADLSRGDALPSDAFDCLLLTQTLQHIFDLRGALRHAERILKPGGVLLATVPGISQISRYDMDRWGDYWRFTSLSCRRLLEEAFPGGEVAVRAHGNALAATAFLQGISAEELLPGELDAQDPDYEVLITLKARKAGAPR